MTAEDSYPQETTLGERLGGFLGKPWSEKVRSLRFRWLRSFPGIPVPVRLPFGSWWLAENDVFGNAIIGDGFEERERRFVERFLQQGMTVLDIGAHQGFYTLLASRKVGPAGKVFAFEPSPRELKRLLRHLRWNRCGNVQVEALALGATDGEAELFVVEGSETGCNSLRLPEVAQPTKTVHVAVAKLDSFLQREQIHRVDFIKLDVEGGELDVLKGAMGLLQRRPRPVILCEVQDVRTRPWGYPAREIVSFMQGLGYQWFQLRPDGDPVLPSGQTEFFANLVAVPEERIEPIGKTGFGA